jgi:hypothetical protein
MTSAVLPNAPPLLKAAFRDQDSHVVAGSRSTLRIIEAYRPPVIRRQTRLTIAKCHGARRS